MKIIRWEASYFRLSNKIDVAASNYKNLIAKTFDANIKKNEGQSPIKLIGNKKKYLRFFLDRTRTLVLRAGFLCERSRAQVKLRT